MAQLCVGPEFCVDDGLNLRLKVRDTGWITSGWFTPSAGWSQSPAVVSYARRIDKWVEIRIAVRRTGANIVPPTSDNIVNVPLGTIVDSRFMVDINEFRGAYSSSHFGGALLNASDHTVILLTLSTTMTTGSDLIVGATFIAKNYVWPNNGTCPPTGVVLMLPDSAESEAVTP